MSTLSVVMPVYNEVATVERAIDAVLGADLGVPDAELIVVDDGSTDGTSELLDDRKFDSNVRLVRHAKNAGKGNAIRTGLNEARGRYTAIFDADLEYEPSDLAKLMDPLLRGDAEVAFGARGFASHTSFSFWYVLGNKFVTMTTNILYNSWISDVMTCHKVIPTELFRSLKLRENGFAIEAEIAARLLSSGVRVYEVPVSYRARKREEGKKLTTMDGLRVLRTLIRCRVR